MNSLKTLVIVALLGAVGYGVYMSITRSPRQAASDGGDAPAWTGGATKAQVPGPNATKPQFPGTNTMAGTSPGGLGKAAPGSLDGRKLPPAGPEAAGPAATIPGTAATSAHVIPPPGYPAIGDTAPPAGVGPAPAGALSADPPAAALSGELAARFGEFMRSVQAKLDENKLDDALQLLSMAYSIPDLPPAETKQITQLLDQLAGTVIYSRQHWLEKAHVVGPGETLDQIAQKYNVSRELLARINGIRDPQNLPPGKELKVVRGPFGAVINLGRSEMTLTLGDRYAGRFPLAVSPEQAPAAGQYAVAKMAAADPQQNMPAYLELDGQGSKTALVGYPKEATQSDPRIPLGLTCKDFEDVSGILTAGSRIEIRR